MVARGTGAPLERRVFLLPVAKTSLLMIILGIADRSYPVRLHALTSTTAPYRIGLIIEGSGTLLKAPGLPEALGCAGTAQG